MNRQNAITSLKDLRRQSCGRNKQQQQQHRDKCSLSPEHVCKEMVNNACINSTAGTSHAQYSVHTPDDTEPQDALCPWRDTYK